MFKNGITNFFKNLLYLFVAMGIIYLFLIWVLYAFVSGVVSRMGTMLSDISELINTTVSGSSAAISEFVDYAMGQIDWEDNFVNVVKQIIDTQWLQNTVKGFMQTVSDSSASFGGEFTSIVNGFIDYVKAALVVSLVVLGLGIYLADMALGFLLRRKIAKKTIKQSLISWLVKPLITVGMTFLLGYVALYIKNYAVLAFAAYVIIYEFMSLTFAYLVYRDDKLKFNKVVSGKNILLSIAVTVVILAIDISVFFAICAADVLIAIVVAIPLAVYSTNIISLNAESYVCTLT